MCLTHCRFDFRKTFEFEVVEKYSNAISDWEVFKANTASVIRAKIDDLISYFRVERDSSLLDVFDELINYVHCKQVLAHLFFSERQRKKVCLMYTRMIC